MLNVLKTVLSYFLAVIQVFVIPVSAGHEFILNPSVTLEINEEVVDSPELLNDESYANKWLIKIESNADQTEFADLLDYSDYKEEIE